VCDVCGKAFAYNHVLKLHRMVHLSERPYKCNLCAKTHSSKNEFNAHMKTHGLLTTLPYFIQTAFWCSSRSFLFYSDFFFQQHSDFVYERRKTERSKSFSTFGKHLKKFSTNKQLFFKKILFDRDKTRLVEVQ